jgi:hypothetical protein
MEQQHVLSLGQTTTSPELIQDSWPQLPLPHVIQVCYLVDDAVTPALLPNSLA